MTWDTMQNFGKQPQPAVGFQIPSYPPPLLSMDSLDTQQNALMGIDPNRFNPANLSQSLMTPEFSGIVSAADGVGDGFFSGIGEKLKSSGFLSSTDPVTKIKTDGWGGLALNTARGIMGGIVAMKNYGLSKTIAENNMRMANKNMENAEKTLNTRYADRQQTRVNMNSNNTSVDDYMKKNRLG